MKLNKRGEEITVAPYGTMRVVYSHFDMGKKGKMQYLNEFGKWYTVAYYSDYADMMFDYHSEVVRNEVLNNDLV